MIYSRLKIAWSDPPKVILLYKMSSNSLANSSRRYSQQKANFTIELELINQTTEAVLFISILNTLTKNSYILKLDSFDIDRDRQLARIFQAVSEIYDEITRSFDNLEVDDDGSTAVISFEVALGTFRKEKIELIVKKRDSQNSTNLNEHSSHLNLDKVHIDKTYHKDYNLFKEQLISICEKISSSPLAKKINSAERWDKNKLKNMFITFSNTILKYYRRNTIYEEVASTHHKNFVQFRPENKLLIQKNDLLHNILMKAVENTKKMPTADLQLDFDISIPKNLIVVDKQGKETPLWDYLPSIQKEQMNKKIQYYQKRQQQLIRAEAEVNLIREKRLDEIEKWAEEKSRRQKKLEIKRRKTNEEVAYPFQQF